MPPPTQIRPSYPEPSKGTLWRKISIQSDRFVLHRVTSRAASHGNCADTNGLGFTGEHEWLAGDLAVSGRAGRGRFDAGRGRSERGGGRRGRDTDKGGRGSSEGPFSDIAGCVAGRKGHAGSEGDGGV